MRVFVASKHEDGTETVKFEVLENNRETHTMHCRWPHGAEFDWQYKPEWIRKYFRIVTIEDDDA
jgi:hypothetical protein